MADNYSLQTLTVLAKQSEKQISDMDDKLSGMNISLYNELRSVEERLDGKFDKLSDKIDDNNTKLHHAIHELITKISKNDSILSVIRDKSNDQDVDIKELKTTAMNYKVSEAANKKFITKLVTIITIVGGIISIAANILLFK